MKKKLYRVARPRMPSQNLLYWSCAILFFFEFGRVLLAFLKIELIGSFVTSLPYVFCLFLYVLRKSIGHLNGQAGRKRKGHIFVIIWIVFVTVLLMIQRATDNQYRVPVLAVEDLIFIVGAFAGHNISKIAKRVKVKGTAFLKPYVILVFFGRKAMLFYCKTQARKKERAKLRIRRLPKRGGNSHALYRCQ